MRCLDLGRICQQMWDDKIKISTKVREKDSGMWSDGVAPTDKWYWCRTRNTAMQGHKTNDKIKVRWQSKDNKRKIRDMGYGCCRTRHNKPCWIQWKSDIQLIKDLAGVSWFNRITTQILVQVFVRIRKMVKVYGYGTWHTQVTVQSWCARGRGWHDNQWVETIKDKGIRLNDKMVTRWDSRS